MSAEPLNVQPVSPETRLGERVPSKLSGSDLTYGNVGHDVLPLWEVEDGEPVFVDAGIVHLLRDLNRRGFTTEFSCQGDHEHRGYISFAQLADLPAVVERLEELLAAEPESAVRFRWGPDPARRDDSWSVHVHRRQGAWGFSVHLPAAWMTVLERGAL